MDAIIDVPFVERFREAETPYHSPAKVGEFMGMQVQELAERAHVHRNAPTARPHTPRLQAYLKDVVRVLAAATELTKSPERAAFLIRNEPLRAFGFKTADTLIQEGR